MMNKPDVDSIDGLSPAISIEQKTTQKNPRSTVGTVTEIYDYLRVLFARVGTPYSPTTGKPIKSQSVSEICDSIIIKNKEKTIAKIHPPGSRFFMENLRKTINIKDFVFRISVIDCVRLDFPLVITEKSSA